jgi:Methyltransferase domain
MNLRHRARILGNRLLASLPAGFQRMLLKGFSDQPHVAEACGFHILPSTFYSPLPIYSEISKEAFSERRLLPGIDLRINEGLALLERLSAAAASECATLPRSRTEGSLFWHGNGTYEDDDATTLYAMLRLLRPARYVEVGCGDSSRGSVTALLRNREEGSPCDAHWIEPFPSRHFLEIPLPGTMHRKKVQEMPLDLFKSLESGDVLFIDTSHVLKVQNDVEFELLRLLPSLKPGVWIHVHDISTPYEVREDWVLHVPRGSANEQYALECLLSGGERFQVELPLYCLWKEHRDALRQLCPDSVTRPGAFWIRRIA